MTNTLTTLGARAALLFALGGLLACGEDTLLQPTFGDGCRRGSLSVGDSVTGAFDASSCLDGAHFWNWNPAPYETWRVSLEAGKGYLFTMRHAPDPDQAGLDDVDPLLVLYGENEDGISIPLAVSDDEGDTYNSLFFFIAPESGTFNLVPGAYDYQGLGGYSLTMQECSVLSTLDTAGTYTIGLPATGRCTRAGHPDGGPTASYVLLAVEAESFEDLSFNVSAADFTPFGEVFGLGFDTYANLYNAGGYTFFNAVGETPAIGVGETAGTVTFAIGAVPASSGNFTLVFDRQMMVAPPAFTTSRSGVRTLRTDRPAKEGR